MAVETDVRAEAITAWVQGWTRSRRTPPPVGSDGVLRVDVHDGHDAVRRVLPRPTPELLRSAVALATEPGDCIKFPGDPTEWFPRFPAGWHWQGEQWLMTAPLVGGVGVTPVPPPGYVVEVDETPGIVVVTVHDRTGSPAASGRAGIAGVVGVPDQIWTEAAHRRRGLGGLVMATLAHRLAAAGVTRQILVASPDGLGLYASMGWTLLGPVTAANTTPSS